MSTATNTFRVVLTVISEHEELYPRLTTTKTTKSEAVHNFIDLHMMSARRVVVGSASSEKSLDLGEVKNADDRQEQQVKNMKQYSFLAPGETWEDALALESQIIQQNIRVKVFAPSEFQYLFEKAILFEDSKFMIIRYLRPIVALFLNMWLYFVAINIYYMNADILFSVGWCVGISSIPVMWYVVYCTHGIRGDASGKPGPGLRVYQLSKCPKLDSIKRLPVVTAYQVMLYSFTAISLLYMGMRWYDRPAWSILSQLLFLPCVSFPPTAVPMLVCLFPYTTDAAACLIERQKVFVYDEVTGHIDWPVVQRNFDILEKFVGDLSRAWQTFFFVASMFWPLAVVMLGIGVGNTGVTWMQGDQPTYMIILLAYEASALAYILIITFILWNGASQVTAACDTVSKNCQDVLSYLRMHPTYKHHREEYLRAEDFARYVEKAKLGFKANGICISYSLGMTILYPVLGAIFAVVLPMTIPSLISMPAGG